MKKLFSLFVLGINILCFAKIQAEDLRVHFIDVRQGDAILIQYEGENYLIDSGKNLSTNKLIDYVASNGVTHLNACLITHPDYDHYGEFEDLVESGLFSIDRFITNKDTSTNVTYNNLMALLQTQGIPVDAIDYQDELNWSVTTDVLSPNYDNGFSGDNDNSIVIKMSMREVDLLLTGDSVEDNNQYLIDTYDIDVEVLKVAHHGGIDGTSAVFLDEVTPAVSVIFSGNNSYGHPSQTVVDLLQDVGSLIYSTADDWDSWWLNGGNGSDDSSEDDDIVLETDGENIWVNDELVWSFYATDSEPNESVHVNIFPNPIHHSANIRYSVDRNSTVRLDIYDIKGRLVQNLFYGKLSSGIHELEWHAEGLKPGIYFCKLQQGSQEEVRKIILIN